MKDLGLNFTAMRILQEEFLIGRSRPKTMAEDELIEEVLASESYTKMVDDLMDVLENADLSPRDYFDTNVKVFDYQSSYTFWQVCD